MLCIINILSMSYASSSTFSFNVSQKMASSSRKSCSFNPVNKFKMEDLFKEQKGFRKEIEFCYRNKISLDDFKFIAYPLLSDLQKLVKQLAEKMKNTYLVVNIIAVGRKKLFKESISRMLFKYKSRKKCALFWCDFNDYSNFKSQIYSFSNEKQSLLFSKVYILCEGKNYLRLEQIQNLLIILNILFIDFLLQNLFLF